EQVAQYDSHELTVHRAWTGQRWLNTEAADFNAQKQEIMCSTNTIMHRDGLMGEQLDTLSRANTK
ncbi:hypothetical protein PC120_g21751, partial [Phytophthora cactorum]